VREALWGGPGFDHTSPFYGALREIAKLRKAEPALRYGRQYFRPISGDGQHFGISNFPNGILSFARILNDREVVIVANTSIKDPQTVHVIIDQQSSMPGRAYRVLYSNQFAPTVPGQVSAHPAGTVQVQEVDGSLGTSPLHAFQATLGPLEVQILGN
jgi:hypothetical protein